MKKTLRILLMGLMAFLSGNALTSCHNDDMLPVAPEGQKGYVEFSLSRGAETRTAYALNDANGLNVTWSEGDKVVVETTSGDIIEVFDLVSGAGTAMAKFAKKDSRFADKSGGVFIINAPGYSSEMDPTEYFVDLSNQEGDLDDLWKYDYFIFDATLNNGKIESPVFRAFVAILHFPKDFDFGVTATTADLVFCGGDNKIGPPDPAGDITVKDVSLTDGKLDDDIYVTISGTAVPTLLKVSNKTFALPAIKEAGKIYNFAESNLREVDTTPLTLEPVSENISVTISNPLKLTIGYRVLAADEIMEVGSFNETTFHITIGTGVKLQLFGDNTTYATGTLTGQYTNIQCDGGCYIYGNFMSLISADDFALKTKLTDDYTFVGLFRNNGQIKNHDSKALTLPATTLATYCYVSMFEGCTNLTKAPALPAKELKNGCYVYMFNNCTSLNYLKCLATSIASDATASPTYNWLGSVPASGTFWKDASVNYAFNEFWDTSTELGSATRCAAKVLADGNWNVRNAN